MCCKSIDRCPLKGTLRHGKSHSRNRKKMRWIFNMAFFEIALGNNFYDIRKSFNIKINKFWIEQKSEIIFLDSREKSTQTHCLHFTIIKYFIS